MTPVVDEDEPTRRVHVSSNRKRFIICLNGWNKFGFSDACLLALWWSVHGFYWARRGGFKFVWKFCKQRHRLHGMAAAGPLAALKFNQ